MAALRILSLLGPDAPARIRAVAPDAEVIRVPGSAPLDGTFEGDVLATHGPKHTPNVVPLLRSTPSLRWVHIANTGVDGFPLDVVPDDVLLTCNRGLSAGPISEWVLASMLAFEKRFPQTWLAEPPPMWNFAELGTLEGGRLGLVGWGGIAQAVARRALPFGMEVRAFRRRTEPSGLDGVEIVDSVEQLAAWADHLVIAAAATPATRHIVDARVLEAAKPGLHIVNIARGSLLDQDALRDALDDGVVARASLDVMEPEPLPEGHWLYEHPDVRLTAHVSWATPTAADAIIEPFLANLERYLAGEPLDGEVDRAAGY
jgi:phosphoglycerate dehydrogenase-like enzyme